MIANFVLVLFQIPLPGTIDGWISNNTDSMNIFTSGRLGGFQGGGVRGRVRQSFHEEEWPVRLPEEPTDG